MRTSLRAVSSDMYEALTPDARMSRALERSRESMESRGLNVIWFGHSLLEVGSGVPIHIPNLVDEIHRIAVADGRTCAPCGTSRMHYEGPNHLGYWFGGPGNAREKLRVDDPGWDFVVGVGFMHLVNEGRPLAWLFDPLRKVAGRRREWFKTYAAYTPSKYQAIAAVRDYGRGAVWVNYVAPRPSDHADEQPFVDERFECIRETAARAGITVLNVPVGRAFRLAEKRMRERPELATALQVADRLHLTKAGEYLAANVFYAYLYGVDPVGLRAPDTHARSLAGAAAKIERSVALLQQAAVDTVRAYERGERTPCRSEAILPEDAAGFALLRGTG